LGPPYLVNNSSSFHLGNWKNWCRRKIGTLFTGGNETIARK